MDCSGPLHLKREDILRKYPLISAQGNTPELIIEEDDLREITPAQVLDWLERPNRNHDSSGTDGIPLKVFSDIARKDKGADVIAKALTVLWKSGIDWTGTMKDEMGEVKMVVFPKKDGTPRIIGVPKSLTRMLHGIIVSRNKSGINSRLHSQNQTLREAGTSNIITLQQVATEQEGLTLVLTDRTNAFNNVSMSRATALYREKNLKEMEMLGSHLSKHKVNTGEGILEAYNIPQGSAAGTGSMAMVVDAAINSVRDDVEVKGSAVCCSFADDISVLAKGEEMARSVTAKCNEGLSRENLSENMAKRQIWTTESTEPVESLGATIGSLVQVRDTLRKKFEEVVELMGEFTDFLRKLGTDDGPVRQTSLRALKMNIRTKMTYLIQHHRLETTMPYLRAMSEAERELWGSILELNETEILASEKQIRLPTNKGGFGLVSLEDTAPMQRLGTLIRSFRFVKEQMEHMGYMNGKVIEEVERLVMEYFLVPEKFMELEESTKTDLKAFVSWNRRESTPSEEQQKRIAKLQQTISDEFHMAKQRDWVGSFSNLDSCNRVNSICSPEAGRPLNVLTSHRPNFMLDVEFLYYTRHRLMLPALPKQWQCGQSRGMVDVDLDHAFACPKLGMGGTHHYVKTGIVGAMRTLARYTGDKVHVEPSLIEFVNLQAKQNTNQAEEIKFRRGDVSIVSLANHPQKTVTIVDVRHCAITKANAPKKEEDIGSAVMKGEREKEKFYSLNFKFPHGVTVVPFTIDSYGMWGEQGKKLVEDLCKKAAKGDPKRYNKLISQARETISLAHARGVGNAFHNCMNKCIPEEDFHLACVRKEAGTLAPNVGKPQNNTPEVVGLGKEYVDPAMTEEMEKGAASEAQVHEVVRSLLHELRFERVDVCPEGSAVVSIGDGFRASK